MKRYIYLIAVLPLILAASSCNKNFLDEQPYSSYTPGNLKDSLGFEASLVGLYNHVSTIFSWADRQGWPSVWQVGTDVANATANQQGIEIPYYNYTLLTPTDEAAARLWNRDYILINLTNTIITNVEDPSVTAISDGGKRAINAEARFFRAYAYNTLATCFGGVPIITTPLTAPKTDFVRAPLKDVDELIVNDLTYAVANLPDIEKVKSNSKGKLYGRANKYMAMQLLGEVYLRMGKPDLAEQQLQAIINSNQFGLITKRYGVKSNMPGDYYSDMFVYGNQRRVQGNTEAIWVLEQENPNTVVGGITDNPQQRRVWGAAYHNVQGMALADSLGGRALGRLRLSNWVVYSLYKGNDIRNSKFNLRRKYYYNDPSKPATFGKPVPYTGPDTLYNLTPHITKWYQFDPNDTFGYAMVKDFILMRLGETYLLLAEAQFKQGKLQDAANSINVLRQRAFSDYPANGSKVEASDITLDFILDERARELIGEENRRMTLMRTKTLVERATRLNSNNPVNPMRGVTSTHLLLPIPLNEIQLNRDAVLEQNSGY
ncbi:RagB/SusD family nutrient uptake outer membrane protein [Arcticibacter sp. MXS-1]|uniref:RagB/SusD family nutrient uptake outer membrane protein n=1 Tax=Arcticibacter sp. MXS-1 TaxID=3341726 RepID=UPI0035A82BCE